MEKKFRLKLENDRIIGPFKKDQIETLFNKDFLKGHELCQEFPIGDWKNIDKTFDFFAVKNEEALDNSKPSTSQQLESTEIFSEFDFSNNEAKAAPKEDPVEDNKSNQKVVNSGYSDSEVDKTRLLKKETKIDEKNYESSKKDINEEKYDLIDYDEKTQEIHISDIFNEVNQEIQNNENDFQKEIENENKSLFEDEDFEEEEPEKKLKTSGSKKIKIVVGIIIGFYVLSEYFVEEKKKTIETPISIKRPVIVFPFQKEFENNKKSKELFAKGIESYRKGHYLNKISASNYFNLSVSHKFRDNPALSYLVMCYAEILENSKDPKKAGNSLFKLIKLGRNKLFNDVKMVIGTAIFYETFGKNLTALNTIENYLRVGKPSLKLLGLYLHLLVKTGN